MAYWISFAKDELLHAILTTNPGGHMRHCLLCFLCCLISACDESVVEPDISKSNDALGTVAAKVEDVTNLHTGTAGAGNGDGFLVAFDNEGNASGAAGQLLMLGFGCGLDYAVLSQDDFSWSMNEVQLSTTTLICEQQVDLSWSRVQGRLFPTPITNEWFTWPALPGEREEPDEANCSGAELVAHEVYGTVGSNADMTIDGSPIAWDFSFLDHSTFHRQICGPGDL